MDALANSEEPGEKIATECLFSSLLIKINTIFRDF